MLKKLDYILVGIIVLFALYIIFTDSLQLSPIYFSFIGIVLITRGLRYLNSEFKRDGYIILLTGVMIFAIAIFNYIKF